MSELLVLVDHDAGQPRKVSAQILTRARQLADDTGSVLAAVWIGPGGAAAADRLGAFGADKLYSCAADEATTYVTLPAVEALEKLFADTGATTLLFPSSDFLKDVASRLAVRLEAGIITDVSDLALIDGALHATKEVFGGVTVTTSRVADGCPALLGINPNAFTAATSDRGPPEVIELDLAPSPEAKRTRLVETVTQTEGERPDIGEAGVVVAGGRGLGGPEGFELLGRLADALGGGLGASRAAADAGWIPHRHQIGQTGRNISPQLYLGVGISGAVQHRAGMQTSQLIAAINKDGEAPLFDIADLAVVGDLYDVVPKLIEKIQRHHGAGSAGPSDR